MRPVIAIPAVDGGRDKDILHQSLRPAGHEGSVLRRGVYQCEVVLLAESFHVLISVG